MDQQINDLISKEIDIPIMVYNNPATTNIDISPEMFAELSKIKNVKYCKESTIDVTRVKDIDRLSKGKIKVFGGIMGYESYLNGAVGWVSVPSNIVPNECANIYKNLLESKNFTRAKKIYDKINAQSVIVEDKTFLHKNHKSSEKNKFPLKITIK